MGFFVDEDYASPDDYIERARKPGFYAGDHEMSVTPRVVGRPLYVLERVSAASAQLPSCPDALHCCCGLAAKWWLCRGGFAGAHTSPSITPALPDTAGRQQGAQDVPQLGSGGVWRA